MSKKNFPLRFFLKIDQSDCNSMSEIVENIIEENDLTSIKTATQIIYHILNNSNGNLQIRFSNYAYLLFNGLDKGNLFDTVESFSFNEKNVPVIDDIAQLLLNLSVDKINDKDDLINILKYGLSLMNRYGLDLSKEDFLDRLHFQFAKPKNND